MASKSLPIELVRGVLTPCFHERCSRVISLSENCFKDLMGLCSLEEGDLIRMFRRIIDMIRQIRHATDDYELIEKLHDCHDKIYREVIRFEF